MSKKDFTPGTDGMFSLLLNGTDLSDMTPEPVQGEKGAQAAIKRELFAKQYRTLIFEAMREVGVTEE